MNIVKYSLIAFNIGVALIHLIEYFKRGHVMNGLWAICFATAAGTAFAL